MQAIESRLNRLERRNRLLVSALLGVVFIAVSSVFLNGSMAKPEKMQPVQDVLRLRMLEIVDENNIVRVRIGDKLPDAVIDGRMIGRGGEEVAGVMLYDGAGQERGGYVTFEPSGNIGLTLDTRKEQVALFAAGPDGGVTLRIWNGADAVEMRADESGARLTAVTDGAIVVQIPEVNTMGDDACSAYRNAAESYSRDEIINACSSRFPVNLCTNCLDR